MARTTTRPKASREKTLHTRRTRCPTCHKTMWSAYVSHRTVSTLEGVCRIHLHVRRCRSPSCSRYHRPFRPEEEGRIALPQHEGNEPTREQCMLGATLANAIKALRLASKHDDLDPLNWTSPLADRAPKMDTALAPGAAAVVSLWQGGYPQTVADARLLLETARGMCEE